MHSPDYSACTLLKQLYTIKSVGLSTFIIIFAFKITNCILYLYFDPLFPKIISRAKHHTLSLIHIAVLKNTTYLTSIRSPKKNITVSVNYVVMDTSIIVLWVPVCGRD